MEDPKVIWLSPQCHDEGFGREWSKDDVWGTCEEEGCGHSSIRYVLAEESDAIIAQQSARVAELERELAALKAQQRGGVVDERAAFEAWQYEETPSCDLAHCGALVGAGPSRESYRNPYIAERWIGWSARARLNPPGECVAVPERWEDRLARMHPTIQAGCWPKRWVDDAKNYELAELRALIAQQGKEVGDE